MLVVPLSRGAPALPRDVLLHVLSFLSPRDLLVGASRSCRAWAEAARDERLWRPLVPAVLRVANTGGEPSVALFRRAVASLASGTRPRRIALQLEARAVECNAFVEPPDEALAGRAFPLPAEEVRARVRELNAEIEAWTPPVWLARACILTLLCCCAGACPMYSWLVLARRRAERLLREFDRRDEGRVRWSLRPPGRTLEMDGSDCRLVAVYTRASARVREALDVGFEGPRNRGRASSSPEAALLASLLGAAPRAADGGPEYQHLLPAAWDERGRRSSSSSEEKYDSGAQDDDDDDDDDDDELDRFL